MPEAIELVTGPAMADEPGKYPPPSAPEAPAEPGWRVGLATQTFRLGELHLTLRLEAGWSWLSPEIDARAGPFAVNAVQAELDAAALRSPVVRRVAALEAAFARAEARAARLDRLQAERRRVLADEVAADDLPERLEALDREAAGLSSAPELARRLGQELETTRQKAARQMARACDLANEKALGALLTLRAGATRAVASVPGLADALTDLLATIRLSEAAARGALGSVPLALERARQTGTPGAPATQGPPDAQDDADSGEGPGPGPDDPDAPQPAPAAPPGAPEADLFDAALKEAFRKAAAKPITAEEPPPPATPHNRISEVPPGPNGRAVDFVTPDPPDDADDLDLAEGEAADGDEGDEGDLGAPDDLAGPGSIDEFVRNECRVGRKETVLVRDLLAAYCRWSETRGLPEPASTQVFGRDLRAAVARLGHPEVRKLREGRRSTAEGRLRLYVGLALRPEAGGGQGG
jgi:hypothetical protein